MNTCGNCAHARLFPQDMTRRVCRGGPPQVTVLPTPKGPQLQNLFPVVEARDEACGAFKQVVMLASDPTKGEA